MVHVEKFQAETSGKLSKTVFKHLPEISYSEFNKILRNKDVKINGVRTGGDDSIFKGDEITIFYNDKNFNLKPYVLEDENIVIINKPRGIEVVSENSAKSALEFVKADVGECYAVHRLDRNTAGLVVFAKNIKAKESLDNAFKNRTIEKFYFALVHGFMNNNERTEVAYLKKDAKTSLVNISDEQKSGYSKIITKYKVIEEFSNETLLEIELITGKTHQIRAHMAHLGHFVVGDEKYGNHELNKIYKKKYQCLTACRIIFHFDNSDYLHYLDGKLVELEKEKIDFLSKNK